jgi:hypothetical protein
MLLFAIVCFVCTSTIIIMYLHYLTIYIHYFLSPASTYQALCPECVLVWRRRPTPSSPTGASCTCRLRSSRRLVGCRWFRSWCMCYSISYMCTRLLLSDCEGAGERFQVTTRDLSALNKPSSTASPTATGTASTTTTCSSSGHGHKGTDADSLDFFGANPAYLTVSGQVSQAAVTPAS